MATLGPNELRSSILQYRCHSLVRGAGIYWVPLSREINIQARLKRRRTSARAAVLLHVLSMQPSVPHTY
jgi:hypothetical protein